MSELTAAIFPVVQVASTPAWMSTRSNATVRPLTFGVTPPSLPSEPPPATAEVALDQAALEELAAAVAPPAPAAPPEPSAMDLARAELEAERAELERAREGLEVLRNMVEEERAELEAAREGFAEAEAELATAQVRALSEARETLIDLAVGIAEALIGREIERDNDIMNGLAKAAIETLDDASSIELRASRESYDRLVEALGAPELVHRGAKVPVVLDETLDGSGFVAASGRARVDGRIAPRLDAVREALQRELRTEGDPA